MSNVSVAIATVFTTTDGQQFTKRTEAIKHQRKLDAIAALAASLQAKFELDPVVGANIAAHLSTHPDELIALLGIVRRKKADDVADNASDTDSTDATNPAETDDENAA